jgi:hypothetical protein
MLGSDRRGVAGFPAYPPAEVADAGGRQVLHLRLSDAELGTECWR